MTKGFRQWYRGLLVEAGIQYSQDLVHHFCGCTPDAPGTSTGVVDRFDLLRHHEAGQRQIVRWDAPVCVGDGTFVNAGRNAYFWAH